MGSAELTKAQNVEFTLGDRLLKVAAKEASDTADEQVFRAAEIQTASVRIPDDRQERSKPDSLVIYAITFVSSVPYADSPVVEPTMLSPRYEKGAIHLAGNVALPFTDGVWMVHLIRYRPGSLEPMEPPLFQSYIRIAPPE